MNSRMGGGGCLFERKKKRGKMGGGTGCLQEEREGGMTTLSKRGCVIGPVIVRITKVIISVI